MLAEAIKAIQSLFSQAEGPKIFDLCDPRRKYVASAGEITFYDVPPEPRDHLVGSLTDLISLAKRFRCLDANPVIWFSPEKVVLVLDDEYHRIEHATLELIHSEIWHLLQSLRSTRRWFNQKNFISLLRSDLAGTLPSAVLLDRVRWIKIDAGQIVTGEVLRGSESMGKQITSMVGGESEFPEDVFLSVPVYRNPGETERYTVRCSVEIDSTSLTAFCLYPWPDELARVQALAMESIRERLEAGLDGQEIPTFMGSP